MSAAPVPSPPGASSWAERILARAILGAFWIAFSALASGLVLWVSQQPHAAGNRLLTSGLLGLLVIPLLRVAAAIASAVRTRDRVTIAAALAVLAILLALTLRDAAWH